MTSWVSKHRADITFIVGIAAGAALIIVGLIQGDSSTILLGAGALGLGGYQEAAK